MAFSHKGVIPYLTRAQQEEQLANKYKPISQQNQTQQLVDQLLGSIQLPTGEFPEITQARAQGRSAIAASGMGGNVAAIAELQSKLAQTQQQMMLSSQMSIAELLNTILGGVKQREEPWWAKYTSTSGSSSGSYQPQSQLMGGIGFYSPTKPPVKEKTGFS